MQEPSPAPSGAYANSFPGLSRYNSSIELFRYINEEPEETTAFSQDAIFYAIVDLANAPDDTITKAIWYTVDAEGVEPNLYISEAEITHGDGTLTFDLGNDYLWPLGTYKVELYLNDELDKTLDFSVSVEPANS